MDDTFYAAFFSYARSDDEHDDGQISALRVRLEGETRMLLGRPFGIFQDRDDIQWGESWRQRVDNTLDAATLLVAVVTPMFFASPECRRETLKFLDRERNLGRSDLILPIYYVDCELMHRASGDELGNVMSSRQYVDWRELRFEPLSSPVVRHRVMRLASRIRDVLQWIPPDPALEKEPKVIKSEQEWRQQLTALEYHVLRQAGTQRPFTGEYVDTQTIGTYDCRACGAELFRSETKFDSQSGWPTFFAPISADAIVDRIDRTLNMVRTEVVCASCYSHLGHVFVGEGFDTPTDLRYTVNSVSLRLVPDEKVEPPKARASAKRGTRK
jgi:peptide-methionine (R)-S-oxide reductase